MFLYIPSYHENAWTVFKTKYMKFKTSLMGDFLSWGSLTEEIAEAPLTNEPSTRDCRFFRSRFDAHSKSILYKKSLRSVQKYNNNNNNVLFSLKNIYIESDKKTNSKLRISEWRWWVLSSVIHFLCPTLVSCWIFHISHLRGCLSKNRPLILLRKFDFSHKLGF